ncbi:elongation factor Ts [Candidatus Parcubacteria bacterium]|nr:elongation factor Ts [Candidatus Parcubacteria bacterium]
MPNIDEVKQLREETGVSITECQKALKEANNDLEKAKEVLRKWGKKLAEKKSSREAKDGLIEIYIHPNQKIGVMLDIRCETDFVKKSEQFKKLAHDLTLQIAGMKPSYVKPEDVPEEIVDKEREIYKEQFSKSDKPEKIIKEILEGKIKKYLEEICLVSQPFVKNPDKTIQDLINDAIAKLGENIIVKRFTRYEI